MYRKSCKTKKRYYEDGGQTVTSDSVKSVLESSGMTIEDLKEIVSSTQLIGKRGHPGIIQLQEALNQTTGSSLKLDGLIGPKTRAAISKYLSSVPTQQPEKQEQQQEPVEQVSEQKKTPKYEVKEGFCAGVGNAYRASEAGEYGQALMHGADVVTNLIPGVYGLKNTLFNSNSSESSLEEPKKQQNTTQEVDTSYLAAKKGGELSLPFDLFDVLTPEILLTLYKKLK